MLNFAAAPRTRSIREDRARPRVGCLTRRARRWRRKMMATDAAEAGSRTTCPCPVPVPDTGLRAVSTGVARRRRDRQWRARLVYLQCYFLTIATILGTGILGLPVTIAHAGLLPFLVSFLVGFFVQALLIYLFVELLQKCQVVQLDSLKTDAAECIVMDQVIAEDPALTEDEDEDEGENAEADTGLLRPDAVALHNLEDGLQPNLHLLGHLFLSRPMSHAFNCVLLFQFISIGISYVLAGSEAYAALLNVSHIYVIPAFTWILTLAILLAHTVIQPVTSVLTLLKGILLIVTVAVTFAVGSKVGLQSSSDFSEMGKPFLMGTVALGGIVNVMPLLFSQISHNKTQILWFRRAVLGGLTTCTVLNILWCWAVLEIVPQTSLPERRVAVETSTRPDAGGPPAPHSAAPPLLYSNISLEDVAKGFMSLLGFSVIFIVSMCDPRGFIVMLDKVVSFSLNTEVGLFVFIMLRESREDRFQHLAVPLPVGDCVFSLTWLLPCYFLFAVTYDVLQTLAEVAHYLPFYSHSQEAHGQNGSGSFTAANVSVPH
ncbi:uncharacterized protein si:ch211-51h4.2 isoform X4 [Scophthalmus maximus]|uniref:uncharacterized protein si:ch211-51h4.2 isoform X4 n=1 Tax=Scophthalmus maximus TaxID=52904 RepID=UPI0015E0CC78|nr:uncharacterized protein si:ch211-51h4.2 isoform X4 [Scophthalmus maximus]